MQDSITQQEYYIKRCEEYEKKITKYETLIPLAIFFMALFERCCEESFERKIFMGALCLASFIWAILLFGWFKKAVADLNFYRGENINNFK